MEKKPDYLGHRSRVRQKFLASLGEELQDYELLEILLFAAFPRQDSKTIAKKLIAKFGNISAVVNADIEMLREVDGIGDSSLTQIKIIAQILRRIIKNSVQEKPLLNNWVALLNYAKILLKDLRHEAFHILFLDKKHRLIEDAMIGEGGADQVIIDVKTVARKALLLHASSVILMHNHPSGELKASNYDIKTTNEIVAALQKLQITVLDHLIISRQGHFSFRESGLL